MSLVGKVHEYSSKGEVSIGIASTSIAPTWPVVLPYGKQVPTTNFYNRNIFCKTLVMEVGSLKLALIACDIIGFGDRVRSDSIKEYIEKECGIDRNLIALMGTHNHSYPRIWDEKVFEFLRERILESVKEALDTKFKARVGFGKKKLPPWVNVNRARPDGPVDTTLYVMRIDDISGALRGIVFLFPSHPNIYTTAWGGSKLGKIGPEWPEYARKYIEASIERDLMFKLYPEVEFRDLFTMFLLGAAGDLQPSRLIYRRNGKLIDPKRAFVETVGESVVELTSTIKTKPEISLIFKHTHVNIPIRSRYLERLKGRLEKGEVPEQYRDLVKEIINTGQYPALIQAILMDNACICTAPGEVTADLGLEFQRRSGFEYPMLVTIANESLGYFVSEAMGIENVRYEAQGSMLCESRGRILINALLNLVNPRAEPLPSVDVERDLGWIEGFIEYQSEGEIYVGVKRECNAPAYGEPPAAPFLGRRVKVNENGYFKIEKLAPGEVYLYADEVIEEGKRPKLLMWGEPVYVRPREGTRVRLRLPKEFYGRYVHRIEIENISIEGYTVLCSIRVDGKLTEHDVVRGYMFKYQDTLKHHKTYLYNPLAEATRVNENNFAFTNISPGDYALFFWLDVNGNGRPEYGVDIISPLKVVFQEDFYKY